MSPLPIRCSAPTVSRITRESVDEATAKEARAGKLALIRPVITSVDGRCVAGPGTPGGLGEVCEDGDECDSGLCANDSVIEICTEICDPAEQGCPDGFSCSAAGDQGVCWPSADGGGDGGGCLVTGQRGPSPWPIVLIALSAIAILNRRRRS